MPPWGPYGQIRWWLGYVQDLSWTLHSPTSGGLAQDPLNHTRGQGGALWGGGIQSVGSLGEVSVLGLRIGCLQVTGIWVLTASLDYVTPPPPHIE